MNNSMNNTMNSSIDFDLDPANDQKYKSKMVKII